jgi:hypothetical protein
MFYIYIYIAPCKASNFNVLYIWTYTLLETHFKETNRKTKDTLGG